MNANSPRKDTDLSLTTPPPMGSIFTLESELTPDQRSYLYHYGYLHFRGVLSLDEVEMVKRIQDELQARWIEEGIREIRGVPLFFGPGLHGEPVIYRLPFSSEFSSELRDLLDDARFDPIKSLVGHDVRIGHVEQDGVILNKYVNGPESIHPRLGWHTDGLRDLFYLRMPQEMLNFGLHFNRITEREGGLRILPKTHRQGFLSMLLKKPYFIWHRPDPREFCVETEPGDMTIHDGRLWHRVAQSQVTGSVRRSLYVPYVTGPPVIREDGSSPAFYQRIGRWIRKFKGGS